MMALISRGSFVFRNSLRFVKAQIRKHVAAGHLAGDSSVMTLFLPTFFAIVRLSHLQSRLNEIDFALGHPCWASLPFFWKQRCRSHQRSDGMDGAIGIPA